MRIVSGIQPTGRLHLGNYLGAIRPWVSLSASARGVTLPFKNAYSPLANTSNTSTAIPTVMFISLADLHAMTVPHNAVELRAATRDMAASLLACGLSPDSSRVSLFVQSAVREHTELAWLCACSTPLGNLQRMTQFKSKSGTAARASVSLGLLSYPVLQAADILLYRATHVPVGEDQNQHLELAREISFTMTARLGGTPLLIPPTTLSMPVGARIMSLKDATKKMSKSDALDDSRINMDDSDDAIARKIKGAKTDSFVGFLDCADRPEKANLVAILAVLTGETQEDIYRKHATSTATLFKSELTEVIINTVAPIRREIERLRCDMSAVEAVLTAGAQHARMEADLTMQQVRERAGYA